MKELLTRIITSEKERVRRYTEFHEYFKEVITTIKPQILAKIPRFSATDYMVILKEDEPESLWIEFTLDDLKFWESYKNQIIIKKSGLSNLKEDLKTRLKILDLEMEGYLNEEE